MNVQSLVLLVVIVAVAVFAAWNYFKRPNKCGCSDSCTCCGLKEECRKSAQ